jgi:hypothetical protein
MSNFRNLVRIRVTAKRIFVRSPYNADFVEAARNRGGTWVGSKEHGGEWRFDARDLTWVRETCLSLYATDGEHVRPLLILRVALGKLDGERITLGGRPLVRRKYRDSRVELGDGVVVVEGGFPASGGPFRNQPRVWPRQGTVLEVRDFPEALARKLVGNPWGKEGADVQIVGEPYLPQSGPAETPVMPADPPPAASDARQTKCTSNGAAGFTGETTKATPDFADKESPMNNLVDKCRQKCRMGHYSGEYDARQQLLTVRCPCTFLGRLACKSRQQMTDIMCEIVGLDLVAAILYLRNDLSTEEERHIANVLLACSPRPRSWAAITTYLERQILAKPEAARTAEENRKIKDLLLRGATVGLSRPSA